MLRLTHRTRAARAGAKPHRSFDPRRVGELECDAWVTYYRREWLKFLRSAVALTRHTFGLPWGETLYGAWLVLRANQLWAPFPDNDPEGARRTMERFYRLVSRRYDEPYDPAQAATLEVQWWRVHRENQHGQGDERQLIEALAALYSYVYGVSEHDVRPSLSGLSVRLIFRTRQPPLNLRAFHPSCLAPCVYAALASLAGPGPQGCNAAPHVGAGHARQPRRSSVPGPMPARPWRCRGESSAVDARPARVGSAVRDAPRPARRRA